MDAFRFGFGDPQITVRVELRDSTCGRYRVRLSRDTPGGEQRGKFEVIYRDGSVTVDTPHDDYTAAIVEFGEDVNHLEGAVCAAIERMNRDT